MWKIRAENWAKPQKAGHKRIRPPGKMHPDGRQGIKLPKSG
jgi:hypothetical protein